MVCLQPQPFARHVILRDARIHRQLQPELGLPLGDLAAEGADRFADHAQIKVEADTGDVAGLLPAEQVACAANLQVFERNLHPSAELVVRRDRCEAVVGYLAERFVPVIEEVCVCPLPPATDPATQLVQL